MTPRRGDTGPATRSILVLAAVAAAVALLLAGGCSSQNDKQGAPAGKDDVAEAEALGEDTAGSVAQLAQCRDWNRGTRAEKLATIDDIRSQVNRPDSGFAAPPLSDAEALEVFDNGCSAPYAQGFRLYLLYARAAAAAPLVRE